jgi:uncharacterized phosphatase
VTFAFIRHGQTDWNLERRLQGGGSDIPLNDTGRQQAFEAIEVLEGTEWAAIVSSPLVRARETAAIVAAGLGIELGPTYEDLLERDYHEMEGFDEAEARMRWPDRDYPGAESLDVVADRGVRALERIAADYGDQNVVIVCHGTIIRFTLARLAGQPIDSILNGSVATLERAEHGWQVLTVNGAPLVEAAGVDID